MELVQLKVADLVALDGNPRGHDERNISGIKWSFGKWGQIEALVVQRETKTVIHGNGRLRAAREMGLDTLWCLLVDTPEEEARAASLALNRTAELAHWDFGQAADLVREMIRSGDDLGALFQKAELDALRGVRDIVVRDGAKDINLGELADGLDVTCPRCGFMFARDDVNKH